MAAHEPLPDIKRRLSPVLLAIDGVSGVGIFSGRLCVYVEHDVAELRDTVAAALHQHAPGLPYEIKIGGRFDTQ
ncbi:MAG: hypothetical protein ABI612_07505 [Betaproteobacteria bacterium]